ncbi:MAG TPA: hypothetical protein DDY13_06550 [Cytophagales bacterium]|jgi:hypothetical protein|nr:hypothetical protein [Cytophagales bacterium]
MKSRLFLIVISLAFFASCAVTHSVMYDYDLNADFDNYTTYVLCSDDFMVTNMEHPNIDNEEVRILIGDAIATAMEDLGHTTNVFEPQLQAGFRIAIKEETSRFNNCEHSDELEYWQSCEIHEETYDQETLIVYVADFESNKVLWQASIPCNLNKSDKKLSVYVSELVLQLFETYPKKVLETSS